MTLGVTLLVIGAIPFVRFLVFYIQGEANGHLQSLVFGSATLVGSLLSFALVVIADLLHTNRTLLEDQLERIKEIQYKK